MIIDAHLHCTGHETADGVLRALDEAGIDRAVLLAPFLSDGYSLDDAASLRRANSHLAQLVRGHPDRLTGFAVIDPRDADAPRDLRRAIETSGLTGVKMVPTGWYPYDARVQPTFAVASELKLPVLFHSGIFIDGRSGRFCRPSFFEALRDHHGVRVALAHLGWPWTDEAIAVGLIDRINGVPPERSQFRFDISFGPPPAYRLEVLRRALDVLGPGLLQFGSDCFLPCPGSEIAERRGWVEDLLDELAVDAPTRQRIMGGTASAWLQLGDGSQGSAAGALPGDAAASSRAPGVSGAPGASGASGPRAVPTTPRAPLSPRGGPGSHAGNHPGWLSAARRMGPACC